MSKQIHFFNEEIKYTVNEPGKICSWLVKSIKEEGKIAGNINFIITSDEILREINLKYLKKDYLTDTVSFTLSDEESIVSGDIYISIERILENSKKYKVNEEDEFKRILIHGVLHLIGYNDKSKKEKVLMKTLEDKYLERFSV